MALERIFPRTVFYLFGLPVRDSVLQGLFIVLVLGVLAAIASSRYRVWEPREWQLVVEYLVENIEQLVMDTAGRAMPQVVPLLTTMIVFIGLSNVLGLIPVLQAPTRDLNTTLAMSIVALGSWVYFGVEARGLGAYLHSFLEPVALMLPLNVLGLLSRMLSMSLRLFGNIIAGEIIVGVLFMLVPVLAPLPLALLSMITSVLQALVFTVLTFVFIVDAAGGQAEPEVGGREAG